MKLGEIVHSYRAEHGLTMQEFAEKSGLSCEDIEKLPVRIIGKVVELRREF